MTSNPVIATKFLIISDTHNFDFTNPTHTHPQPFALPTPTADVLLHCGDLTQVGGVASFKKALRMLGSIPSESKLVIAGNHDLELDKVFWEAQRDENGRAEDPEDHVAAAKIMTGTLAAAAGVTFLNEGTHSFTLGSGARFTVYVSPYTPAFCDWAFAYEHNEDRFNGPRQVARGVRSIAANPLPDNVNIVMTHGPPQGIRDWCSQGNVGCEHLLRAVSRVRPKTHCFGHVHEGYGMEVVDWERRGDPMLQSEAELWISRDDDSIENLYPEEYKWEGSKGGRTLAVNAAIMSENYEPENAPWLISLDLTRSPT